MKPVDLRNASWSDCLAHVTADMLRIHQAWLDHGPCTTRQLALRTGLSLLTLRPRTTDLYKLGLVELSGRVGNEGVYVHRAREAALRSEAWRARADFRCGPSAPRSPLPTITGFPTVEAAINSLPLADRAALGAKLMSKYGALIKHRESNRADQLTLAVG